MQTTRRRQTTIALVAGFWSAVAFAPAASARGADATAPPPIVDQAIRTYEADTRGVIGVRSTGTATVTGQPPSVFEFTNGVLWVDGSLAAVKIYDTRVDGRDTTAEMQGFQPVLDRRPPPDPARSPLRAAGEPYHRYDIVSCADCPSGVVAASFTSNVRDAEHRDGTLWIERSTGHVLKMISRPAVARPNAREETTTTYGPVLPGTWGALHQDIHVEVQTQSVTVTNDMAITFDRYRRFATDAEGRKAVESGAL